VKSYATAPAVNEAAEIVFVEVQRSDHHVHEYTLQLIFHVGDHNFLKNTLIFVIKFEAAEVVKVCHTHRDVHVLYDAREYVEVTD
jgi:hypothetical protein